MQTASEVSAGYSRPSFVETKTISSLYNTIEGLEKQISEAIRRATLICGDDSPTRHESSSNVSGNGELRMIGMRLNVLTNDLYHLNTILSQAVE